jgi:hypothetical protein
MYEAQYPQGILIDPSIFQWGLYLETPKTALEFRLCRTLSSPFWRTALSDLIG